MRRPPAASVSYFVHPIFLCLIIQTTFSLTYPICSIDKAVQSDLPKQPARWQIASMFCDARKTTDQRNTNKLRAMSQLTRCYGKSELNIVRHSTHFYAHPYWFRVLTENRIKYLWWRVYYLHGCHNLTGINHFVAPFIIHWSVLWTLECIKYGLMDSNWCNAKWPLDNL